MATSASSAEESLDPKKPRSWRWALLLAASLLLHVIAFNWADGRIGLPALRDQTPTVISTELLSMPPPSVPVAAVPPVPDKATPKPRPKLRSRRANAKPASSVPEPAPQVAETAPDVPPAGMEAPGTSIEPATEMPASASSETPNPAPAAVAEQKPEQAKTDEKAAQQTIHYKINPPPSAELKYDVQALREGQTVYGHGKINWQAAGNNYTVTGEAGILFFTVLNFRSEGMIDEFGVSPVLYSEKRFRKSETNTHFHRERNTISFSASTVAYPRKGGEQDRASIIWQLAGIGRGDADKFTPGADIDLFVAGVRDAETWRIHVVGREDIEVGTGKANAWHVVRIPRPGSYDQKIDIWLAPEQEWYPIKLRYTETNGDFLDMSLSNMHFLAAN
jgi:hypothetical protein